MICNTHDFSVYFLAISTNKKQGLHSVKPVYFLTFAFHNLTFILLCHSTTEGTVAKTNPNEAPSHFLGDLNNDPTIHPVADSEADTVNQKATKAGQKVTKENQKASEAAKKVVSKVDRTKKGNLKTIKANLILIEVNSKRENLKLKQSMTD